MGATESCQSIESSFMIAKSTNKLVMLKNDKLSNSTTYHIPSDKNYSHYLIKHTPFLSNMLNTIAFQKDILQIWTDYKRDAKIQLNIHTKLCRDVANAEYVHLFSDLVSVTPATSIPLEIASELGELIALMLVHNISPPLNDNIQLCSSSKNIAQPSLLTVPGISPRLDAPTIALNWYITDLDQWRPFLEQKYDGKLPSDILKSISLLLNNFHFIDEHLRVFLDSFRQILFNFQYDAAFLNHSKAWYSRNLYILNEFNLFPNANKKALPVDLENLYNFLYRHFTVFGGSSRDFNSYINELFEQVKPYYSSLPFSAKEIIDNMTEFSISGKMISNPVHSSQNSASSLASLSGPNENPRYSADSFHSIAPSDASSQGLRRDSQNYSLNDFQSVPSTTNNTPQHSRQPTLTKIDEQ